LGARALKWLATGPGCGGQGQAPAARPGLWDNTRVLKGTKAARCTRVEEAEMPESLVREYMTRQPTTLRAEAKLRDAVELVMVRRIRHIPIVDGQGGLVGIITDRDVKRALPSQLSALAGEEYELILDGTPISRVMTREPHTVAADTPVAQAVEKLLAAKVGGLPVLDGGKLVGIFTERDALHGYLTLLQRLGGGASGGGR
jgi:CBS domain-containing protein